MLCFVVRCGGIGRYYILDLEPILYFLVGWGGVGLRRYYSLVSHVVLWCGGYNCELP